MHLLNKKAFQVYLKKLHTQHHDVLHKCPGFFLKAFFFYLDTHPSLWVTDTCIFVKMIIQMAFLLAMQAICHAISLNEKVIFGYPNYSRSRKESVQCFPSAGWLVLLFMLKFVLSCACKSNFKQKQE